MTSSKECNNYRRREMFIDTFPKMARYAAITLVFVEVGGFLSGSKVSGLIVSCVMAWVFFPVFIVWCVFSIRRARDTGVIEPVVVFWKWTVRKENDSTAFLLTISTYWAAVIMAIFFMLLFTFNFYSAM